jgi:CBS domain-containing protein
MAGKADWAAYGLPMEKTAGTYVGDRLEIRPPTCALHDSVATARQRLAQAGGDLCAVINEERVVLGACDRDSVTTAAEKTVEEVMRAGPKTLRPSYAAEDAMQLLRKSGKRSILVTSSDGKLMGLFTTRE